MDANPVCTISSFIEKMKTLWNKFSSNLRSVAPVLQLTCPALLGGEAYFWDSMLGVPRIITPCGAMQPAML